MDYTLSNGYATDAGTGQRMHLQAQAIPTAVTDVDVNGVIWEMMEVIKAGGLAGAQFDKTVPASYQKLLAALRSAGVFTTPATGDRTTKAATTAMFGTEFAFSASSAGYQKLPSGIWIQWGVLADAAWVANTFRNISYPVTFPNQVLQHCAVMSNSAGTMGRVNTNQLSASQLQLAVDYAGSATVRWVAFGN